MSTRKSAEYRAVKAALRKLSRSGRRSPKQIADYLVKWGIKQDPNHPRHTPVACYLAGLGGGWAFASEVRLDEGSIVPVPPNVEEFTIRYLAGEFPQLQP